MKVLMFLCKVAALVSILAAVAGCRDDERTPAVESAKSEAAVEASEVYRQFFGEPPAVGEGRCFALVGYYPLTEQPEKLAPFPLFLFNRQNRPQVVTQQLLQWGEGWNLGHVMTNPFPPGTRLLDLSRDGDLVRLELSPQVLTNTDDRRKNLIVNLLGLTLTQFEEIERVMVVAGGELLLHQAERGFVPDASVVVPPGPPRTLGVAGVWAEGAAEAEEVSVHFDRPVRVESIRLETPEGRELAGDYYRSIFDMAVVVHPAEPDTVSEGMPLHLAWKVVDSKGREGQGEDRFNLIRLEHP